MHSVMRRHSTFIFDPVPVPEGLGYCPCVQSITMVKARQPRRYSACGRRVATTAMLYCGPVLRACACSACLACLYLALAVVLPLPPRGSARGASARRAEGKKKKTKSLLHVRRYTCPARAHLCRLPFGLVSLNCLSCVTRA
jgi:hypothetical protein